MVAMGGAAVGGSVAGGISVRPDVGVKLIGLPRPLLHIVTQRFGLRGLLVCLLSQPGGVNLCLFRIGPGAGGLCLTLPGVEFPFFCFPADLCGLFAVRIIALLLQGLPPPSGGQQQHHDQRSNDNSNSHPNPYS